MNSNQIVANKINQEFTRAVYTEFYGVEIDTDTLDEKINTLLSAMNKVHNESDCWKIAKACVSMWPSTTQTETILRQAILAH